MGAIPSGEDAGSRLTVFTLAFIYLNVKLAYSYRPLLT